MKRLITPLSLLFLFLLLFVSARAEPYRIVVIPDSQWASAKWPDLLVDMTRWIKENRESQNIRCVLHVGDMVQNGGNEEEWKRFDTAMSALDGKVPYVLAVGNHDFDKIDGKRSPASFNRHFPVTRFKDRPSFGGSFPEGSNNNSFHTFQGGDTKWLVVSLTFAPNDKELEWANAVVAKHPAHRVIILTHSYLTHQGRDRTGVNIWEKFASKHANISLVFCGHLSTVHREETGPKGNKVYEMLFDWQNDREPENNSYFAIIEIDPEKEQMSITAYSPTLDKERTDNRSRFTIEKVDFLKAKE